MVYHGTTLWVSMAKIHTQDNQIQIHYKEHMISTDTMLLYLTTIEMKNIHHQSKT